MVDAKTVGKSVLLVAVVVMGLGLAACSRATLAAPTATFTPSISPTSTPRVESQGLSAEMLSKGAELYAANCQSCHGDREGRGATGGAPPHSERGHTWHHPDAQLNEWILNGKPGVGLMPGFKDKLTEGDIDAVLAYIKTWWSEEQRESQADISRRYQEALDRAKAKQ